MEFAERYGPWAVIAGASEGTGREFARKVAARGVNCILLARREGPLEELAQEIRAESSVECETASVDLSKADASQRVSDIVADRDVGLYISNAGADPNGAFFLDKDVDAWVDLVNRNVITSMRCSHSFGGKMRERGRGGILLVGSGACYGGGPNLAVYSGSKAFEMCFAEGLWSEFEPHGVHVLYLAMSTTDTPELRRLLASKGLPPPPGLASASDVAEEGLARLPHGPVHNWNTPDEEAGFAPSSAAQRRDRVNMIAQASRRVFGDN